VQYQKDAVIRYKAFPQFWGGKAKIDDLVFSITPDASPRHPACAAPTTVAPSSARSTGMQSAALTSQTWFFVPVTAASASKFEAP